MNKITNKPKTALTCAAALTTVALWGAGCFSAVTVQAPKGEKLEVKAGAFPHATFNALLTKYVNDKGQVDYKGLKTDREDLQRYLVAVSETSPKTNPELFPSEEDKLAYWINAYNAYTIFAVTERPKMKSVNDDSKNFFYFTEYSFGGKKLSLYKLENEVVRKEFKEPRIHFALNCASGGCPELPAEAFMPDKLEAQLAREAKEFCAHPEKVKLAGGEVKVSQIFEWYGEDFEADGGPIAFCRKWGREDLPADAKLGFIPYDWSLNAQPGRALFE